MEKKHKLIIVGDSAFAEIAYEYFTHDSEFELNVGGSIAELEHRGLGGSTILGVHARAPRRHWDGTVCRARDAEELEERRIRGELRRVDLPVPDGELSRLEGS